MSETIVRIAARGDGVSESGKHVARALPGDVLHDDGRIENGPAHREPPCRHFPTCGGCQLQHASDEAYADYCRSRVVGALAQQDLTCEMKPTILSPPHSRRRATLRLLRAGKRIIAGFNEQGSNKIVDMRECHVLVPEIVALVEPIRKLVAGFEGKAGEAQMTLLDQGVDLTIKGFAAEGLDAVEALDEFARRHALARLSLDEGYGAETRFEPVPATITLGRTAVPFPHGAFLQATKDGEAALVANVKDAIGDATMIADLFAGLGTFALSVDGEVSAVEAARDAILSLKRAAPGLTAEHRDLYRRPLEAEELEGFDAVILDPPRSGAAEQVARLANSAVPRIAYVSCNPATFARDSKLLTENGYKLAWARAVGQFRWSTHVELVAAFTR